MLHICKIFWVFNDMPRVEGCQDNKCQQTGGSGGTLIQRFDRVRAEIDFVEDGLNQANKDLLTSIIFIIDEVAEVGTADV